MECNTFQNHWIEWIADKVKIKHNWQHWKSMKERKSCFNKTDYYEKLFNSGQYQSRHEFVLCERQINSECLMNVYIYVSVSS